MNLMEWEVGIPGKKDVRMFLPGQVLYVDASIVYATDTAS